MSEHPASTRVEAILDVFEADDGELWNVLERIAQAPHRALEPTTPLVWTSEATAISADLLARSVHEASAISLTRRRQHFMAVGKKWRFLKVFDDRSEMTYDTVPNRFVAFFLRSLIREVSALVREWPEEAGAGLKEEARWLRRRLRAALERGEVLRTVSRLQRVPHNQLSLNHDPRYRKVMQAYVELLVG